MCSSLYCTYIYWMQASAHTTRPDNYHMHASVCAYSYIAAPQPCTYYSCYSCRVTRVTLFHGVMTSQLYSECSTRSIHACTYVAITVIKKLGPYIVEGSYIAR